jgi:Ca-activated chloride channel family protein
MNFEHFHFLRPEWFLAIIPLVIIILAIRYLDTQQSGWNSVLASHLYQHLVTEKTGKKNRPPLYLLAIAWSVAVVAIAGPAWEKLPQPVYQLNTGKVVVIDMSMSMRATDVQPDRLTRAKYKAIDLVNAISEGETGLVAYSGDAFTISPLSTDGQNLTALIPSLMPEIMPVAGSEPFLGLQSAVELLQNAGFQQGEIFWITDGIETEQISEVRKLISSSPYRLSILAVGTAQGAPIKMLDGELLKDATGAIVLPRLTSSSLRNLAATGGGRFSTLQATDKDIQFLTSQLTIEREAQERDEEQNNMGDEWKEMGPYLVLLLLPFAAYSFRRGLLPIIAVCFLLPAYSPNAQADWWQDLWKTADQQGQQAFEQQQYESAADAFEDPLWKGSALYKKGDYEAALLAFSQSDSIDSLYNRGNTLAQLGDIDKAISAYDEVLKSDPTHEDAIANKALLEQQQQQQQQQQQNQDNQEQQDSEQQNSDQQQDSEDQQSSEQQEGQEQQDSQQQQQQSDQSDSEQSESNPQESDEQQSAEQQAEQQEQEQQDLQEQQASEQQQANMQPEEQRELTDEEKEQMQRLQNLLRKVPDDPGYLLKQKMLREHNLRKRERMPTQLQRNW